MNLGIITSVDLDSGVLTHLENHQAGIELLVQSDGLGLEISRNIDSADRSLMIGFTHNNHTHLVVTDEVTMGIKDTITIG